VRIVVQLRATNLSGRSLRAYIEINLSLVDMDPVIPCRFDVPWVNITLRINEKYPP